MSFIKNTYQVKKLEEMDKKIKKIFSVPTSTVYEIKQNLENRNKRLKKKFFYSIFIVFFLSITLIWQVFFPYSVFAS
ncbi:hypothetical protein N9F23_04275 [Candidatus Pelagibacter sp.]|jgi:hypothetical protein|nr:hypothetical protein [Candidatus Pelagibacter sp.]|tara:strand:+ start:1817 stop:2047 length:231 start_codon:yes stop_codon:yes gene_type:complete